MPVQTELSKTQVMDLSLTGDPPWPGVWSQVPFIARSPLAGRPGRYIDVLRFEGRAGALLLQPKVTLKLFAKRREFITGSGFLTRRDMTLAVESDVKPHTFLLSLTNVFYLGNSITTSRFE